MGRVTFNDKGQIISEDTGEVLGQSINGHFSLNSDQAEMKTAEQLGIIVPQYDEKDDFSLQIKNKQKQQYDKKENIQQTTEIKNEQIKKQSSEQNEKLEEIKGPTSFQKEKTKYEISNDTYFVIKFGLLQRQDGRFVPISEHDVIKFDGAESHWVKFRMWNYGEQLKWKAQCTEYNGTNKMQYLNNDKLNEKKIKNLILDWSFGIYEDRLKLLHCDGKLSDESYKIIMGMYPSIINTIVDLMNYVLESNQ